MATKQGPKVSAIVDETTSTVTIGVEHDGQFLPVATKDLGSAKARNLSVKGEPVDGDDDESEG